MRNKERSRIRRCRGLLPSQTDQTLPWFYGLWRYVKSGIPDDREKQEIVTKMVEVTRALEENGWRMPCDPPSRTDRDREGRRPRCADAL